MSAQKRERVKTIHRNWLYPPGIHASHSHLYHIQLYHCFSSVSRSKPKPCELSREEIQIQQKRQIHAMGKDSLFNEWCRKNQIAVNTCKKIKLDYFPTPYTQTNSEWIKDLNLRPETQKLLEENKRSILSDISLGNIFFGYLSSGNRNKK